MSSYFADSERRCSGYDEYEGIFGPLAAGASSFSGRQARGRDVYFPWRRTGASHRHARQYPPDFDRRAKYLESRSDKRRHRQQLGLPDGEVSLSEGDGAPSSAGRKAPLSTLVRGKAAPGERQQVWLPSRSFAFRQRSGKLDTRAIARLDLEKIAATTDVEAIQRHLENLAFADVTLDDVQHYSDAYFLKLFQIAQLTLEYLMHVQDSLVDHSESLESQCEQLLDECQQLEADNDKQEGEIASLKREIRQKQRTMTTLELMLLNASSRKLPAPVNAETRAGDDKENAATGANALVEELLTSSIKDEGGGGLAVQPIECVLCEKRFVSVEYLLLHQEKKHRCKHRRSVSKPKKRKQRSSSSASSGSSSSSSPGERASRRGPREHPVPPQEAVPPSVVSLPKEVVDALEEKNQLARQLVELQSQVRAEQEARNSQRKQIETQQTHLTSQVMEHLGHLQSALVAIERKQEAAKLDMIKHTEDAIKRIQEEAAEASRRSRQSVSRIGTLESDQEDSAVHPVGVSAMKSTGAEWSQLEKVMDTFLRAQALKQQEIDALQQQNAKLASKATKRRKQRRDYPELPTTLLAMTALEAARFGVDYGQTSAETEGSRTAERAAVEEKTVQADDEEMKPRTVPRVDPRRVQTDQKASSSIETPRRSVIQVRSSRNSSSATRQSPPETNLPTRVSEQSTSDKATLGQAMNREDSSRAASAREIARRQAAARVVGKVVLRFLRSKRMEKQSSWRLVLPVSSLKQALDRAVLARIRLHHGDQVSLQVTRGMTANRLRHVIADALSSVGGNKDSVTAFDLEDAGEDEMDDGGADIAVDRVVLRHLHTSVELCSEAIQIHLFKDELEVDILPPNPNVRGKEPHATRAPAVTQDAIHSVTRLQARVRGFVIRRKFQGMRKERSRAADAGKAKSPLPVPPFVSDGDIASQLDEAPSHVSTQCEIIRRRLSAAVRRRVTSVEGDATARSTADGEPSPVDISVCDRLSANTVAICLANVELERKKLPGQAQERVEQLEARVDAMVKEEIVLESADDGEKDEQQQLQTARRRLNELLFGIRTSMSAQVSGEKTPTDQSRAALHDLIAYVVSLAQAEIAVVGKEAKASTGAEQSAPAGRESADSSEIRALADAYERNESDLPAHTTESATASKAVNVSSGHQAVSRLRHAERSVAAIRVIPVVAAAGATAARLGERPGTPTPTPEPDTGVGSGRGSPPSEAATPASTMISPFSKTPLISRRARRGTGFENAR